MSDLKAAVPVLPVADTVAAAAFYRDRLGFAIAHADSQYAIVTRDAVELHLWAARDRSWQQRSRDPADSPVTSGAETFLAGTASCRVLVGDLDELYASCRAAGVVHPNGSLSAKPYGLREFAVLDGDGNLITYFQPLEAIASPPPLEST